MSQNGKNIAQAFKIQNFTQAEVQIFYFEEDGLYFASMPALDITGYGKTEKEAAHSLDTMVDEFISYTAQNNLPDAPLKDMQWRKSMAASFAVHFIKTCIKQGTIKSAFKKIKVSDSLYYGIILIEDNFENRETILEFLNFYSTLNLSHKIPVFFQFVTEELKSSFKNVEFIA